MTLDQIDQMVRQANPVPDLTVLEPVDASVLVRDQQRRTEMQTHDRVEVDHEPEKSGRGYFIGIAAAAAIVIGVLVLFRPVGDAPVAAQPTTAVEVATAFVEAYAAFDAEKAASYLTEPALAKFSGDLEGLRLQLSHGRAQGWKLLLDSCEAQSSSPSGTLVRCAYDYHGIRSDEIGLGPYGGSWFDITVLEGGIVSVSDRIEFMSNGFSAEMWEPFGAWVAETYPEDVAIMYTNSSQTMQSITDESNQLWELRSIDYVAVVLNGAAAENIANQFVEAYVAHDADQAMSYLANDADLTEFVEGGVEGLRPSIRFDQATGFKRLFDSCVAMGATPTGMSVRCPYDYHGIRSEEIGLGPYSGSWLDIAIEDGRIVSVSDEIVFMENGFSAQMWEPFAQWIGRTYPEDGAIMYVNWPNIFMAQFTDESIDLWEEHSIEYVAVVKGS